jgi:EAL domain-containing protein (putative c-di-GMP-specific phosphodiesterase class I)/ActR/RegA family two-component response regulator
MTNKSLYVLDDDEQYAQLLSELAKNAGWTAIAETDPVLFLSHDLSKINVLTLDLNMPGMDGIEVIREIAERKCNLKLILVSGFDARVLHSAQQLAEAHNIKVVASLTKPVSINEFIKVLDTLEKETPSYKSSSVKNSVTAKELENAIKNDELILYYQPQIDIKTNKLSGVEALVRWNHPERGIIFPDQFIYLAEENNLIGDLTESMIYLAVKQNKKWHDIGFDTVISVNVSIAYITSLNLPEKLIKLLDQYDVNAKNIMLELTESAVMGELTTSLDVLNRLRMKGFSLSIDDFGTGYSSLSHLYQAPFTELKIDQGFVMHILEDAEAMVIVKICIMLGQMLGMSIVAEGVETEAIYDKLEEMGCDIAQGYFLSRPIPADQLYQWKQDRNA